MAASILMKVADDAALRARVAREQSVAIGETVLAVHDRLRQGGKLILFGNGGSATDANDWAIDCVAPPSGMRPVPAVSLAHGAGDTSPPSPTTSAPTSCSSAS